MNRRDAIKAAVGVVAGAMMPASSLLPICNSRGEYIGGRAVAFHGFSTGKLVFGITADMSTMKQAFQRAAMSINNARKACA